MEIWNLVTENLTKNSSLMSADWNSSAVESVDSVPWSESRWARGKITILRNLHVSSTFASDTDCTFDEVITPLRQILLPSDHGPLHPVFKQGMAVAAELEKFLLENQSYQTQTQQSLPLQPAAFSEAAGPAGTAF